MLRRVGSAAVLLPILFVLVLLSDGCTPQCDYPEIRVAKLRIVNAMPDQDSVTIWLNGRRFWPDYPYEVSVSFPFGYYDHYADGTPLSIGSTFVVVTADAAGRDTLVTDTVKLNVNRQTLIVMGRVHAAPTEPNTKKVLLLDDQTMAPDPNHTYIRFIHAIPDLPSLDIHWHTTPDGKPNATIDYGKANPYSDVRMQVYDKDHQDSLIVTEAGNPKHIIALIPYAFTSNGFFVTIVIRGRTKPIGNEHSASTFILSDAQGGSFLNDFSTFGVRIMNASRSLSQLSLLIKGPADSAKQYDPRSNYPQQATTVLDIPTDSLSSYLALNPGLNAYSHYVFSTTNIYSATTKMDEWVVGGAQSDDRYTFVSVEKAPLGSQTTSLDHLILRDTMTIPEDRRFNRVRVVMVSPDHPSIAVGISSLQKSLAFKEVAYFDVPVGATTLTLADGSATRSVPMTVVANRPMSIYLLPAQSGAGFPVKIVSE
ncbi:MAG: DUF4397 domain-containing protein [Bacteroidetes bacterium]|nr:DUF4397 domain-containing protein [Bacteroidota bacterium]